MYRFDPLKFGWRLIVGHAYKGIIYKNDTSFLYMDLSSNFIKVRMVCESGLSGVYAMKSFIFIGVITSDEFALDLFRKLGVLDLDIKRDLLIGDII